MHGIRMFTVAANQKNPLTNKFILRLRAESGFEVLLRDRFVLKGMISRLRDGKFLAMLPDLRQRTEGVAVRFLGKTANVPGGMAAGPADGRSHIPGAYLAGGLDAPRVQGHGRDSAGPIPGQAG